MLLAIICDQLKKKEKSLKFTAKKTRINTRNTACLLRWYPRKGFARNPSTCATEMQVRRNIRKRLSEVTYLISTQRVGWWESSLDDFLNSLSVLHCYKAIIPAGEATFQLADSWCRTEVNFSWRLTMVVEICCFLWNSGSQFTPKSLAKPLLASVAQH